jgi:hypothetical protein
LIGANWVHMWHISRTNKQIYLSRET